MQRDAPARGVVGGGAVGCAVDGVGAAGGAYQRFLVSVRRDQNQRFRRAVLLDAPTSHSVGPSGGALWHGSRKTRLLQTYRPRAGGAKVRWPRLLVTGAMAR